MILLAFLVVLWRTQPAKADVTITAFRYTLDDVTWIGLDGATLEPGYINVAVTWRNNSTESVDTLLTLVVEDQGQDPDEERVTVAPNEEVTAALLMEFMEGERRVTAIIYKEDDMVRLDSKTVSVSVVEIVPPPEPSAVITDIKAQVNTTWVDLAGLDIKKGDTLTLGVFWQNTTPNAGLSATTSLTATKPDGATVSATPITGETRLVDPGGTTTIMYSLLFDMAGTWSLEAVLDGDIV